MEHVLRDLDTMTTGELWVQTPLFPVMVMILGLWVLVTTVVLILVWKRCQHLEQNYNKLESSIKQSKSEVLNAIECYSREMRLRPRSTMYLRSHGRKRPHRNPQVCTKD